MNKPGLKLGQRWLWRTNVLAEIVSNDTSCNAIVLDIKKISDYEYFKVGEKFAILSYLNSWEYLEGQDAIKE
jgi:hypothetical protein